MTEPVKDSGCDRLCLVSDCRFMCPMNEVSWWGSNSVLVGDPEEGKLGGTGNGRGSSSLEIWLYLCPSL